MAKITKAMLEKECEYLRQQLKDRKLEIERLTQENRYLHSIYDMYLRGTNTLIIALERTNDATAHVLMDLSKRSSRL